jgi:putative ABC transport system permease protein
VVSFQLIRRNLLKHKVRSGLTIASIVVAIFLLCVLQSLVVALTAGVRGAKRDRLVVQSAVSLFVGLPMSYQDKIAKVAGVKNTCKFQWFGGYYQDPSKSFFAQFAVDADTFFDCYPDVELVQGTRDEFLADRQGCIIGEKLAEKYDWKIGDSVPIIGGIFPSPDGSPWIFHVKAIYHPASSALDAQTIFFQWKYLQDSLEQVTKSAPDVGTYTVKAAPDANQQEIIAAVEQMFENGPQRVNCTTEAEFQAQFVSMVGNIPFFVNAIGLGVLVAIVLACVNTMLMAFREQTHDVGILKALGFTDGGVASFMLTQSLLLCLTGGVLGLLLAKGAEPSFRAMLATTFPNYAVTPPTLAMAGGIAALIGLVSGLVPALRARQLRCVDAMRSVE